MPVFLTYVLSFVFLGIYWNNHHHMLHAARTINGGILWANLHLLFWLSLVPFVTGWMGENHFAPLPDRRLRRACCCWPASPTRSCTTIIVLEEGPHSKLAAAVGRDRKGKLSLVLYAAAIPLAFVNQWIADAIYVSRGADVAGAGPADRSRGCTTDSADLDPSQSRQRRRR